MAEQQDIKEAPVADTTVAETQAPAPEAPAPSAEVPAASAETQTPKGRAAMLAAWREKNPDGEDPDDDSLFDYARSSRDELQGKYDELSGANGRLAEMVAKDPKLGAVLSMIVADKDAKSLPYAMGRVYGKDWADMDEAAMDEFEKGYQDNLAKLAESNAEMERALKNIEGYKDNLSEFGKRNNLTEDQLDELNSAIFADAENFLMGVIPMDYIEYRWKGMNYDQDVQDAADTGVVEGRNQTIEAKMKETAPAEVPDLGATSGAGKPMKKAMKSHKSFYDDLQEVK